MARLIRAPLAEQLIEIAGTQVALQRRPGKICARRVDDNLIERFQARLLVNARSHPVEIRFEIAPAQRGNDRRVVAPRAFEQLRR